MRRNAIYFFILLFQFFYVNLSWSIENEAKQPVREDFISKPQKTYCFMEAANYYKIDVLLLISIAEVESGLNSKAIGINRRNGKVLSEDVGVMQINSSWFPFLEKNWGITRSDLLNDPCRNIYVGAYILAKNISSNGVNWESVGAYNAGFKEANAPFRMKYAKKVYDKFLSYQYRNHTEVINLASNGMRTIK